MSDDEEEYVNSPDSESLEPDIEEEISKEELEEKEESRKRIDRMTLELLVPKSHYRKYLEKTDPAEYEKKREKYERFLKYRNRIGALTKELLNDYSVSGNSMHLGNTEIQELFAAFLDKCISFFEIREWSSENIESEDAEAEDDVLFGNMYKPFDEDITKKLVHAKNIQNKTYSAPFANHYQPGNSFWGKNINKR